MEAPKTQPSEAAPEFSVVPPTGGSLLRERNFRLFFVGQTISNTGTWLQNVAQGVLVHELTGGSTMVGVTSAALFMPVLLLALHGGRLADRFDRRRLMLWSQVLAFAAAGTLALLAATGSGPGGNATVAAVVAVAVVLGVQYAVSIPTMQALLPALVPAGRLGEAIGLNSITYNSARVIGPLIATGAIAALGFAWTFGINALSFIVLIAALAAIRIPRRSPDGLAVGSVKEGVLYALKHPRIRLMLVAVTAVAMAMDPIITLGPAFAHDVFGRSGSDAGLVVAAFALGAIIVAVGFARIFRLPSATRLRFAPFTMLLFAAGLVAFAWMPSFWPALAAAVVGGMGFIASGTTWTTGIQEEVSDRMRGRVMGLWTLCFLGSRPIASLIDGSLADLTSPRIAVAVIAAPVVLVALFVAPRLRIQSPQATG